MREGHCFRSQQLDAPPWKCRPQNKKHLQVGTRRDRVACRKMREDGDSENESESQSLLGFVFTCGWGHYPKRLNKPQHSTPGLKETERRCHHGYLGSKVLTYGEGYLRWLTRRTGACRWPCQLPDCLISSISVRKHYEKNKNTLKWILALAQRH